jgi:hypothetical protein
MVPRKIRRRNQWFLRTTVQFRRPYCATQDRLLVFDALIRAHGFRITRGPNDRLARANGRFRSYVARRKIASLRRRLKPLVANDAIALWIAGKRAGGNEHEHRHARLLCFGFGSAASFRPGVQKLSSADCALAATSTGVIVLDRCAPAAANQLELRSGRWATYLGEGNAL